MKMKPKNKITQRDSVDNTAAERTRPASRDVGLPENLQIDNEAKTITFTAASSEPLYRSWGGHYGWFEQLDINTKSIDILAAGNAPVLLNHNRQSIPVGRVTRATLTTRDSLTVLEVEARFTENAEGSAQAWNAVTNGLLRNVSVGWQVEPDGLEEEKRDFMIDGVLREFDFVRYTKFKFNEVSLVTVPADQTVGLGRSLTESERQFCREVWSPQQGEIEMDKKLKTRSDTPGADADATQPELPQVDTPAAPAPARAETPAASTAPQPAEQPQTATFDPTGQRWLADNESRLREQHGLTQEAINKLRAFSDNENGRSQDAMRIEVFKMIDEQTEASPIGRGQPPAINTGKGSNFSMARLATDVCDRSGIAGLEREMIREVENVWQSKQYKIPQVQRAGAMLVPWEVLCLDSEVQKQLRSRLSEKTKPDFDEWTRAYSVGATPAGYFHEVFDESWFVEALIAEANLLKKVTFLPNRLTQDLVGVSESKEVSTYWTSETGARAESTTLPSYANRTMKWHQINGRADVNARTLDQSDLFATRLMSVMNRDIVRGINLGLISGTGKNNQVTGITKYTGLPTVAIATNGGAPTWTHITQLEARVNQANVNTANACFAMDSTTIGALKRTARFPGSTGAASDKIISTSNMMLAIDEQEVVKDNNMPKTLVKGTASNARAILYGAFDTIEVGTFSAIELFVDPYTAAASNQTRIFIRQACDISPRYPAAAVAAILDVVI